MNRTTDNTMGVIGITDHARMYNAVIGSYEEHFLNERFRYTVRLSNGRIEMSREIAEDYETQPQSITEDRVIAVAETYQNH